MKSHEFDPETLAGLRTRLVRESVTRVARLDRWWTAGLILSCRRGTSRRTDRLQDLQQFLARTEPSTEAPHSGRGI